LQHLRFCPGAKVDGSRNADVADTLVEIADVAPVFFTQRVPESVVLCVEGALGDDGFVSNLRPVNAVRGVVRQEPAWAGASRLVALALAAVRVGVLERREVIKALRCPDDVVLLRAAKLEEAQLGSNPVEAVLALGVASDERSGGELGSLLVGQLSG